MRVFFVVNGDANSTKPWSGVPNRLLKEMMALGHEVVNFDLSEVWYVKWPRILFNRVIRYIVRPWVNIPYETTALCIKTVNFCLRHNVPKDVDVVLATSFCIDCTGLGKRCILFHDWTVGYARCRLHGHPLSRAEEKAECNQIRALATADKVVTLYPQVLAYLKDSRGLKNAQYICNPINVVGSLDREERKVQSKTSRHFLTIGGNFYRDNIEYVIQAADALEDTSVEVDVIGRTSAETQPKYCKVNFWGFLDRANPEQCRKYYEITAQARALVNIKKGWGGASTISESMYWGIPVVIAPYPEIQAMYGDVARYGFACEAGNVSKLTVRMREMLDMDAPRYEALCADAYGIVKNDTYDQFMKRLLA